MTSVRRNLEPHGENNSHVLPIVALAEAAGHVGTAPCSDRQRILSVSHDLKVVVDIWPG
jgi:hypothetical protein